MAGFTVSVDNADGQGSVPDAAVLLAATAWGRVRRRRRRRRCGRVAWVRGSGGGLRGVAFTELRVSVSGVLGAVLLVVRFRWLALRFLSIKPMARGLCRMLPCFWLLPCGDVRGPSCLAPQVLRGLRGDS